MAAGRLDITIEQNADFRKLLTFTDSSSTLIDFTGATFEAEIRVPSNLVGDLLATFTIEETDLANGEITLVLTDTTADALSFVSAEWDLYIVYASGLRQREIYGLVDFNKKVTD